MCTTSEACLIPPVKPLSHDLMWCLSRQTVVLEIILCLKSCKYSSAKEFSSLLILEVKLDEYWLLVLGVGGWVGGWGGGAENGTAFSMLLCPQRDMSLVQDILDEVRELSFSCFYVKFQ